MLQPSEVDFKKIEETLDKVMEKAFLSISPSASSKDIDRIRETTTIAKEVCLTALSEYHTALMNALEQPDATDQ